MRIAAKFVLNRAGFRNQVLLDNGSAKIVDTIMPHVKEVAPPGTEVVTSRVTSNKGRVRIRIVDRTGNAADRESKEGNLSQALNRLHVP